MFIFWFLHTIAGIVPFYSKVKAANDLVSICFIFINKVREYHLLQGYVDDVFSFVMFFLSYVIILIQLVLSCFAEKVPQRRYSVKVSYQRHFCLLFAILKQ